MFLCAVLVTFEVLCRIAFDPSTPAWVHPTSLSSKIDRSQKKRCPSLVQPPSDFRDTTGSTPDASLVRKGSSDVLEVVYCAADLGAMTQGVWSFVQK